MGYCLKYSWTYKFVHRNLLQSHQCFVKSGLNVKAIILGSLRKLLSLFIRKQNVIFFSTLSQNICKSNYICKDPFYKQIRNELYVSKPLFCLCNYTSISQRTSLKKSTFLCFVVVYVKYLHNLFNWLGLKYNIKIGFQLISIPIHSSFNLNSFQLTMNVK